MVVALIGVSTALVAFALPDPASTRLDREAVRLSAILEAARAQARTGAMTVVWLPTPKGPDVDYQFLGMPPELMPSLQWNTREVRAEVLGGRSIVLGPEPVIGAQSVMLRLDDRHVIIGTDGLDPFDVLTAPPDDTPATAPGA